MQTSIMQLELKRSHTHTHTDNMRTHNHAHSYEKMRFSHNHNHNQRHGKCQCTYAMRAGWASARGDGWSQNQLSALKIDCITNCITINTDSSELLSCSAVAIATLVFVACCCHKLPLPLLALLSLMPQASLTKYDAQLVAGKAKPVAVAVVVVTAAFIVIGYENFVFEWLCVCCCIVSVLVAFLAHAIYKLVSCGRYHSLLDSFCSEILPTTDITESEYEICKIFIAASKISQ